MLVNIFVSNNLKHIDKFEYHSVSLYPSMHVHKRLFSMFLVCKNISKLFVCRYFFCIHTSLLHVLYIILFHQKNKISTVHDFVYYLKLVMKRFCYTGHLTQMQDICTKCHNDSPVLSNFINNCRLGLFSIFNA